MPVFPLKHHSDTPPSAIASVTAEVGRDGSSLKLTYTVTGDIPAIVLSPPANPVHTDELWRTTCFELFVLSKAPAYLEYNFSPSGAWAQYGFSEYRAGMRPMAPLADAPRIILRTDTSKLALTITAIGQAIAGAPFNLTAVIEELGGIKSYWALAHPDGPPDFHDPSCFLANLPE